jgi:prevent-host-death family protein
MSTRISATDLVRKLGDILGRIRYRGESFTIERNGTPVARLTPIHPTRPATVAEAFAAWREVIGTDHRLADDLERVRAADHPPGNPWAS